MKKTICSVYDIKTKEFDQPFAVRHLADAIREFQIIAKNPQTKWGKNPEDFSLYAIGEFDDESGQLLSSSPHTLLSQAQTL